MRVGLLGTGAIAEKHAQAYRNLGFDLAACSNRSVQKGQAFAERWGCRFIPTAAELCKVPRLDFVDVCTFPDSHVETIQYCCDGGRAVLLQKPMAVNLEDGRTILDAVRQSGIVAGVVSQHRFDDASLFLKRALDAGRLGRLLEADAYVKWFRSDAYYARPGKGSWAVEGGGALINQAIHQADLLQFFAGPVVEVQGTWQLGACHAIQSEDIVNALLRFRSGTTGVIQASTAFWPGQPERIEIHGTRGTAIVTGDRLTHWDVLEDGQANAADPAPLQREVMSGASDPMAINLTPFERQFLDFAAAVRGEKEPLTDIQEGYRALALVCGIYESCRNGSVKLSLPA